ncbi:chorion peroxidase-like [Gordionus sp. m RMFG-2023]|uniref:chorion peroxidase-like n=1 Tax=Gordionus sp. m RMFG-2023 TaxID=3053472 RepID=UPI0031FC58E0
MTLHIIIFSILLHSRLLTSYIHNLYNDPNDTFGWSDKLRDKNPTSNIILILTNYSENVTYKHIQIKPLTNIRQSLKESIDIFQNYTFNKNHEANSSDFFTNNATPYRCGQYFDCIIYDKTETPFKNNSFMKQLSTDQKVLLFEKMTSLDSNTNSNGLESLDFKTDVNENKILSNIILREAPDYNWTENDEHFETNPYLSLDEVNESIDEAISQAKIIERDWDSGLFDLPVEGLHDNSIYNFPKTIYAKYGKIGIITSLTSHILGNKLKSRIDDSRHIIQILTSLNLRRTLMREICPVKNDILKKECTRKYRTYDGYCNNLRHKTWGMSMFPPMRLLPPDYADKLNSPRKAKDGTDLPNARLLSMNVFSSFPVSDKKITSMITNFGQFVDHEINLFPLPYGRFTPRLKCCEPQYEHPLCLPLPIPNNDSIFNQFNHSCMEMMRSLPGIYENCRLGPRQQINQLTSFIDGSVIYGSTPKDALELRTLQNGMLKTLKHPLNSHMKDLLPLSNGTRSEECTLLLQDKKYPCFLAGEERANENVPITAMHILWVREHNRIAEKLSEINQYWNDETLYQESRRIVGAILQNIIYKEFLPKVLGNKNMQKYLLDMLNMGYFTGYNEKENPTIANAFSTAAFRFGHSLLKIGYLHSYYSPMPLRKSFFNPKILYGLEFPEGVDSMLRGSFTQLAQAMDENFVPDIKHNLFKREKQFFGRDLLSINLQRGRDHGIPGYNEYREWCGLKRFYDWKEMEDSYMHSFTQAKIKKFYKHPDDIDLFLGGICEKAESDSLVGPTFACIIGRQFQKLRFGDRFWFENAPKYPGITYPFTREQLEEIRKVSLAKIICINSDNIVDIQKDVFLVPSTKNRVLKCEDIPNVNFDYWKQ